MVTTDCEAPITEVQSSPLEEPEAAPQPEAETVPPYVFPVKPDESFAESHHQRLSVGGIVVAAILHIAMLLFMKQIVVHHEHIFPEPALDGEIAKEVKEQPLEDQPVDFVLADPDERELEVRKVLNATSVGVSKTVDPKLKSPPEVLREIDPTLTRREMYDIPEGVEVSERVVVQGTTGNELVQIESALDRVTWEIASNLQERKVLLVWMLDASGSLKAQREAIVNRLDRIYGELDALKQEELIPRKDQPLITGVVAYGAQTTFMTKDLTNDYAEIKTAIAGVPEDPSGQENVFTAINQTMGRWAKYRSLHGRRIMLVVVTDETGDDFAAHEPAIDICRRYGAQTYVIGPHAVFGRRKGRVPYVAPENGQTYQLPVDLGPETPAYDLVDLPYWYGGPQHTYLSSGFGPYALTRMVRMTGGIYFATKMTTMSALAPQGYFGAEAMKPFEPDYKYGLPEEYLRDVQRNPLRMAVINAARLSRTVKPEGTPSMELRVRPQQYRQQAKDAQKSVAKSEYYVDQILSAFPEGIEKQLDRESSPRWRVTFALAYGRLLAQKVRCLEYNLALADMAVKLTPEDVGTKSNHWIFKPHEKLTHATAARKLAKTATDLLQLVNDEAPGTPWAVLAQRELRHPLGLKVIQRFIPPPPPPKPRPQANPTPPKPRLLLAPEPKKPTPPPQPQPKPRPPVLPRL